MAMAQLFFLDIKRNRFSLYILNLNKEYETEPIYFIVPFVTILFMTYFYKFTNLLVAFFFYAINYNLYIKFCFNRSTK